MSRETHLYVKSDGESKNCGPEDRKSIQLAVLPDLLVNLLQKRLIQPKFKDSMVYE